MKSKIIFFIVILQSLISTAQDGLNGSKPSTINQLKLKGAVKTIEIHGYSLPDKAKPDSVEKKYFSIDTFHPTYTADNSVNDTELTLMSNFNSQYDSIKTVFTTAYMPFQIASIFFYKNDRGTIAPLLKGQKTTQYSELENFNTNISSSYSYTYTTDNKILEIKEYEKQYEISEQVNDSLLIGTVHYKYNQDGLLTEKEKYQYTDSTYTFQQFNQNKDLIAEKIYGLKEGLVDKTWLISTTTIVYKYKNGTIEEKEITSEYAHNQYVLNDPKGKLVMGFPYIEKLTYNPEKDLVERNLYAFLDNKRKIVRHTQYNKERDAAGNILTETESGQFEGCMPFNTVIKYEYDKMHNCTKKRYHYDNIYDSDFIVETSYTYY